MAVGVLVLGAHLHQGDELIAHVDEGLVLAPTPQGEIEDPAVKGEGFLHIADLERYMIHADEPGFAALCSLRVVHAVLQEDAFSPLSAAGANGHLPNPIGWCEQNSQRAANYSSSRVLLSSRAACAQSGVKARI